MVFSNVTKISPKQKLFKREFISQSPSQFNHDFLYNWSSSCKRNMFLSKKLNNHNTATGKKSIAKGFGLPEFNRFSWYWYVKKRSWKNRFWIIYWVIDMHRYLAFFFFIRCSSFFLDRFLMKMLTIISSLTGKMVTCYLSSS